MNKKVFVLLFGVLLCSAFANAQETAKSELLDAKCACSMHAMEAKGLTSPLMGDSDVLIMPDIEAGNVFYKAITLFAGASTAGLLLGAKCPAVVPSRADSAQSKFYSLAVATMAAE